MVAPVGSCADRNGLRQRDPAVFGTCTGGIYSQCGDDALNGFIRKYVESVDPSILKTSDLQECRKLFYAVAVGVACAVSPF